MLCSCLPESGVRMKTIRVILLTLTTLCAYALCFCVGWMVVVTVGQSSDQSDDTLDPLVQAIGYLTLATVVFVLLNAVLAIIYGVVRRKRDLADNIARRIPFVFKLILIPFFIVSIVLIGIVAFFGYLASSVLVFFPVAPLIAGAIAGAAVSVLLIVMLLVCYLVMVSTSVHSTSDILYTCRKLNVHRGLRALYIILQYVPVADVVSLPIITSYLDHKS